MTIVLVVSISLIAVISVVVALLVVRNNKLTATSMRLLRRVNVVTLEDANGKEKAMTDNMKLQNGNALKTEADSMVSVGLDDYKVVTVEENSRAEFYQSGKQLELNLTEGSLFIDVSQHLADDESFDVRTSTMTAGIRGTTIYVNQNEDGTWTMYLVSGALHVRGQNPDTLEEAETDIVGGQKVTAITFSDRETETIILRVEEFSEEDMPLKLVEELVANPDALERAGSETGFDVEKIAELAGVTIEPDPNTETESPTETETVETETASSEEEDEDGDGENGEQPEGEGDGEGEEVQEEDDNLINNTNRNQNENVSEDGDTEGDELTAEESEATQESEEGFNLKDYLDYIDEDGIWHLKDGTLFDPNFYRSMYGEILEGDGFVTDEDLLKHYLEYGKTEKRFTTQESYDEFTEQYLAEKRAREEQEKKEREEHEEWERQRQQEQSSGNSYVCRFVFHANGNGGGSFSPEGIDLPDGNWIHAYIIENSLSYQIAVIGDDIENIVAEGTIPNDEEEITYTYTY
ncbi:MAG: FecR domain-containing protein [Lachnospiraceae bacterium]|nr:FecR domain-containing protein [Lachnospiraceae bacterium]